MKHSMRTGLPSPASASDATGVTSMKPLAVSVSEFRRLSGGIGKTLAFSLIAAGEVERVKIGGRTGVTLASIERFIERATEQTRG